MCFVAAHTIVRTVGGAPADIGTLVPLHSYVLPSATTFTNSCSLSADLVGIEG